MTRTILTKEQIEAMSSDEIAATREDFRQSLMAIVVGLAEAADADPIDVARSFAETITSYGRTEGWSAAQLEYAVGYIADIGRELQQRFEVLVDELVETGVEVWCHRHAVPARYGTTGCTACHCDGVHTTLIEASASCTHGADCPSHPGAAGPHNYDR